MNSSSFWPGLKVLVTGGSGFLGAHLIRRLCEQGSQVHATSRANRPREKDGPIWWQGEVADLTTARSLISEIKPDIVYHLSGAVGASPGIELVLPTFHSLLTSTVNLLTAATETGCRRIVQVASLTEPKASHTETIPGSPYAAAKWAASGYGRMFQALYGTPTVIVRPYMTYGPAQDPRKLIPSVILSLLEDEVPRLASGQWRADWIYIDDVIEGFLAAAQAPNIEGNTIDLGSGSLVSVRTVVQHLVELLKTEIMPVFGALPDRPFEPERGSDTASAHAKLGWKPKTTLNTGLGLTIEWYRKHGRTAPDSWRVVTASGV